LRLRGSLYPLRDRLFRNSPAGNDILLNQFHPFGRTFRNTGSARSTFGIIHHWNTPIHGEALLRTIFHAGFALYTAHFAGLFHHGLDGIPVGTEGNGSLPILWYIPKKLLGTFGNAGFTSRTFVIIDVG
jgi:hypothetical protein